MPRTIVALIVIWALAHLYAFILTRLPEPMWPDNQRDTAFWVNEVLRFVYTSLIVALVAHGLMKGLRLVWVAAFVWQSVQVGFALLSLVMNDFEAVTFTHFGHFAFYGIVLPLAVAAISFVLLLAPATQRWIRES